MLALTAMYEDTSKHIYQENPYLDLMEFIDQPYVILPWTKDLEKIKAMAQAFDGFVFAGGHDINPKYYGEENLYCEEFSADRDDFEYQLMKEVHKLQKPVLGICRGFQLMNVLYGGSLYQDLESQWPDFEKKHTMEGPYNRFTHAVFVENEIGFDLFGMKEFRVNTRHHQGIKDLAQGLSVIAKTKNGLIEAVVDESLPFFCGVQWHPEALLKISKANVNLIEAFKKAIKKSQV